MKSIYLTLFVSIKSLNKKSIYILFFIFIPVIVFSTNVLFPFKHATILGFLFITILLPTFIVTYSYSNHKNKIIYNSFDKITRLSFMFFLITLLVLMVIMIFAFLYYFFIVYLLQLSFSYHIINENWFYDNVDFDTNHNLEATDWKFYEFSTAFFSFISMTITTFSILMILDLFNVNIKISYIIMFSYLIILIPFNFIALRINWDISWVSYELADFRFKYSWEIFSSGNQPLFVISSLIFPHLWTTNLLSETARKAHAFFVDDGNHLNWYYYIHWFPNILILDNCKECWLWNSEIILPWIFFFTVFVLKVVLRTNNNVLMYLK